MMNIKESLLQLNPVSLIPKVSPLQPTKEKNSVNEKAASSSSTIPCYQSCIERACSEGNIGSVRVSAVQARRVSGNKGSSIVVYAIYFEDLDTGRSWVVLRRYSEIASVRTTIKTFLSSRLEEVKSSLVATEETRSIKARFDAVRFPSKYYILPPVATGEQKFLDHRARMIFKFFQESLAIASSSLESSAIFNQFLHPRVRSDPNRVFRQTLVSLIGGNGNGATTDRYSLPSDFQFPAGIPQSSLSPEARVAVTKCGELDTIYEEGDYSSQEIRVSAECC